MLTQKPFDNSVNTETCRCGRLAARVHCPECGSYQTRCRTSKIDLVDGRALRCYICRVCGCAFNDDDWKLRCNAVASMRALKSTQSVCEQLLEKAPSDVRVTTKTSLIADGQFEKLPGRQGEMAARLMKHIADNKRKEDEEGENE